MGEKIDIDKAKTGQHVVVKFGEDEYLFWSSVIDAPITYLMTQAEAYEYMDEATKLDWSGAAKKFRKEMGDKRKARLEKYGTTEMGFGRPSVESAVGGNKCGPNYENMTVDALRRKYKSEETEKAFVPREGDIIPWED